MMSAVELRAGITFIQNQKLYKVLQADHHKPGKGNTVMRLKLKDLRSGAITETTMHPDVKLEQAIIETKSVQYLYLQDQTAVFMDLETYEQYEVATKLIQVELPYLVENMTVKIDFYNTEVVGITLPTTVTLTVTETQPAIKGATVSGSGKPATLNTGLVVTVPDFVNVGDQLEINTQDGSYVKRVNK